MMTCGIGDGNHVLQVSAKEVQGCPLEYLEYLTSNTPVLTSNTHNTSKDVLSNSS